MVSRIVTTPQAVCYVNNQLFGRVSALSLDPASPHSEVRGVDVLTPVDFEPGGLSVSGSMTIYRLHQDGGSSAAGLVADWKNATRQKYWSLLVVDRVTDQTLYRIDECVTQGLAIALPSRAHATISVSFSGLDFDDGTG